MDLAVAFKDQSESLTISMAVKAELESKLRASQVRPKAGES